MTDQPPRQSSQTSQTDGATRHPNPGGERPVERIDDVLDAVRTYWTAHPDLRLGQIITSVCESADPPVATFFVEDAYLADRLRDAP